MCNNPYFMIFDHFLTVWTSAIFEKSDYLKFGFHIIWIYDGDKKYSIFYYCIDIVEK